MSDSSTAHCRVTHRFNASCERVFDAMVDPAKINGWMFGPALREEEVLHIQVDAQVGGAFSFLVRRQGHEIDHIGEYLVLDRPRQLIFTWAVRENLPEQSRVAIEIVPQATGCEVTLTHELAPDWESFAPRVAESWTKMLAALARLLDSEPQVS